MTQCSNAKSQPQWKVWCLLFLRVDLVRPLLAALDYLVCESVCLSVCLSVCICVCVCACAFVCECVRSCVRACVLGVGSGLQLVQWLWLGWG